MLPRILRLSVVLVVAVAVAQAAPVESRFDTDGEGWTVIGDVHGATWLATEGLPPGCFKAIDDTTGLTWYFVAPAKFLGDQSAAYGDTLSYDLWISARDATPGASPWVSISGGGLRLDWSGAFPTLQQWTHYEATLMPAGGWMIGDNPATEAEMQQVLANVTSLQIRGEFMTGADFAYLDNVVLVPEAEAAVLLLLAGVVLLRRR